MIHSVKVFAHIDRYIADDNSIIISTGTGQYVLTLEEAKRLQSGLECAIETVQRVVMDINSCTKGQER